MSLAHKEDWEETKARYSAWWAHEAIGRCALSVKAVRRDAPAVPPPPEPRTVEERWWDLDAISARNAHGLARVFFGGEALPVWSGGYPGHTAIPAFLGCPTTLDMHTGWWDPILTDEDLDVSALQIDEQSRCFRFAEALLRRGVEEARGRALVTIGAFGGCGDTLAALRGTERLLVDCAERPEQVRAAEARLMDIWFQVYDRFYAISIGPKMYCGIFLPVVERQTEFLTHAVYHVDGIGNFAHVDALLELPRLQAIQILPGAGKPSPLHYMPVLKKVQAAEKNLHISIKAEEVETALRELSARGLFLEVRDMMASENEARDLLKKAEHWSRDTVLV